MRTGTISARWFVSLIILLVAAACPAAWAVTIPPPGVFAHAVLEDSTGTPVAGPVSFSDGQPGVADVNAFTGAVNEARGRSRLPGSTGSSTRIDSPGTLGVVQGRSEARQVTNWVATYHGSGPAPAMVEIDLLAVYKGTLAISAGVSPLFPGPGELFASVHAELNLHLAAAASVTNVFVGDAELDFFSFVELGLFSGTGPWDQDWTTTPPMSANGGTATVDTFQVCRASNTRCGTTLVPVGETFGFEVYIGTEAKALAPGWFAEADFLATLEGTPMISHPDFSLVQVPEPGTATLLTFGLLGLWAASSSGPSRQGPEGRFRGGSPFRARGR
jgi:hypothetical protein